MASLEDAANRDLTGREVISFMVLNQEEAARVRAAAESALAAAVAKTIARLPKRGPTQ